ncbi:MAG TPA: sterol desaturase family protein [Steroidobacteraceae bacterium]|nr:sterol desaturase family protein [Steroidobacteraceae bacterium]
MMRAHGALFAPLIILGAATLEAFWLERTRGHYDWRAYFASLGDVALRSVVRLLPLGITAPAFNWLWSHRLYTMPLRAAWPWAVLFVGQEFLYYWLHRADHAVRWLWATHSVHHSPNDLNLSAAYRLGWTQGLSGGSLFFAPLVLAGFAPLVVGGALGLNLLYQFWLHAPWMPGLGPLEWVLNSPAHHRVHHASNPEYLDANFGGVLIVFDRCFGTFRAGRAGVALRYGLVEPLRSYNPLLIGLHGWIGIARDAVSSKSLRALLAATLGGPRASEAAGAAPAPRRSDPFEDPRRSLAGPGP